MRPERVAALVERWVRFYTRDLAPSLAARRAEEIRADLHDHVEDERSLGTPEPRIARAIVSRMVRGMAADVAWRREHATTPHPRDTSPGGPMQKNTTTYRLAILVALGSALLLCWGVLAMGVIGAEGDSFDLLYLGVLAAGVIAAAAVRFRPRGMVRVLLAMAVAHGVLTVVALILGKQESPVSSVAEIVGLNGFFAALFLASAWLFGRTADRRGTGDDGIPT